MHASRTLARSLARAAAALLLLAGCRSDDVAQPRTGAGATRTLLTDDPFPYDRVARVDLHVVSVSASLSADTGSSAGGFVTLATPDRRIDMLALQNGVTAELGTTTLPTGAITAVRMIIDTDKSSITLKDGTVLTGSSTPGIHWQSSAGRPTLDALVQEQIAVPDSGAQVVLDFDVGRAFITPQEIDPSSTDRGFVFSPVVRAADARRTGSIAGEVRTYTGAHTPVKDASIRLYLGDPNAPENTWGVLATARTDANGAFRLAYVTPSAHWQMMANMQNRSYIVAVDPPAGSGLSRSLVRNVTVVAGAENSLGAVELP